MSRNFRDPSDYEERIARHEEVFIDGELDDAAICNVLFARLRSIQQDMGPGSTGTTREWDHARLLLLLGILDEATGQDPPG